MNMEWRNGGVEEGRRMVLPFFHSSTLPLFFSKQEESIDVSMVD
jgi:hypothetical protein